MHFTRKRAKKADFGRFPGWAARHPLSPQLLHPHLRQPNFRPGGTSAKTTLNWKTTLLSIDDCDPKVLLQGPETSKVPKVIRRGCKRSLAPREQSPLALVQKRVAPVQNRVWVVQKTLGRPLPLGSKTPFAPSPNHFLEVAKRTK